MSFHAIFITSYSLSTQSEWTAISRIYYFRGYTQPKLKPTKGLGLFSYRLKKGNLQHGEHHGKAGLAMVEQKDAGTFAQG